MKKIKIEKLELSIEKISDLGSMQINGGNSEARTCTTDGSARDACPSNRVCTTTQIKTKCDV